MPSSIDGLKSALELFNQIGMREIWQTFGYLLNARAGSMGRETRESIALGAEVSPARYKRAIQMRTRLTQAVEEALCGVDALATPTMPSAAPVTDATWDEESYLGDSFWLIPFNITGHPAITIPCHYRGLPVGLQLVGHRGADEGLVAVARWVESELRH